MKRCTKITLFVVLLIAFGVTEYLAETTRPEWKKISPFTAVEIGDKAIRVEFEDTDYELVSIEKIPTVDLIAAAKKKFGRLWKKRIREDIAEVLEAAGFESTDRVDLELRNPSSGKITIVSKAKMTTENRNQIYQSP